MTSETHGRFKRWFWRPPRAHGEIIADRQVSVLELFYDLVYVAVIGQAARHLAGDVTVRKALRRSQMLPFFAKLPPCLVGIEVALLVLAATAPERVVPPDHSLQGWSKLFLP